MEGTSIFIAVHKIDRENSGAEKIEFETDDLEGYVSELVSEIINNINYRYYNLISDTSEVYGIIKKHLLKLEQDPSILHNIANKYWRDEVAAARQVKNLKIKIKKGFLIEALLAVEGQYFYFISKVEVDDFIDEIELIRKQGLPYKEKALKSCIFVFNDKKELLEIMVSDKNKAKYWSDNFLSLEECTNNEISTKHLFETVDRSLKSGAGKSTKDYYVMRNALISYFQSPRNFRLEEMYSIVLDDYVPINQDQVDVTDIKNKIEIDIRKKKLDTEFAIVPSAIKKRMKTNIQVNPFINLELQGATEEFDTMIVGVKEGEQHYLKIQADKEVYDIFIENRVQVHEV